MGATPSRVSGAVFAVKANGLRLGRLVEDVLHPVRRHPQVDAGEFGFVAARAASSLWVESDGAELWHERGKVHNLRLAAERLDGCVVPAGEVFSFWRQVGRASAGRGYQPGRMLKEGCLMPAVGGGLCQLSNALYQAALDAGCEIVERHGHSRVVPGSAAVAGRDATVAWNYVDLRFRPWVAMLLRVELTAGELVVRFFSAAPVAVTVVPGQQAGLPVLMRTAKACDTCGRVECFRHHNL